MTRNELLDELVKLDLEEKSVKRSLDLNYLKPKTRTKMFYKLRDIKNEKEKIKFRLRLERELKNENNNTK